jgi:cobalt-zinc-cadmium efflux system outer membrane protein
MSPRILLLLGAALLLPVPAMAQRSDLPPEAVVVQALDTHPAVLAAGSRVTSAQAHATMLRKGSQEFTIQGIASHRSIDGEGNYAEFDANLIRPVRLPGKARLDKQAGVLGVEVAHNQMEDMRHQTALAFSNLWHDWLIAGALYRNDQDSVASLRESLRAVRRRVELRDAGAIDADQADAALAQVEAQAAASASAREEARARLAATFPDIPLPDEPPALAAPALPDEPLETMRDEVISRSHEIRAAEREADRLDVLARRAQADRIADPSVGVRLFSERGGIEQGAGVIASIPIGGGYRRAERDRAAAEAGAGRLDLARVRREVEATASADISNIRTREQVWTSTARAAQSGATAAGRTRTGYRLGAIDLAETLLAQRQANDARRQEIQARGDFLRAILKLQIDSHNIWTANEGHED